MPGVSTRRPITGFIGDGMVHTGDRSTFDHGAGRGGGEPVFVSRPDPTAEDAGWLITLVHDATNDGTELVIIDAQDFDRGYVATDAPLSRPGQVCPAKIPTQPTTSTDASDRWSARIDRRPSRLSPAFEKTPWALFRDIT